MASKKILCPYCFEEFENTEALYQCESEERDNDGDYRCSRVTSDNYDRYWKGEELPMRYIWAQQKGFLSRLWKSKLNEQKCPQCGYRSRRFVCPHCHNWLPTRMIENGSEIISVIGSPSSGKTNYIVALIHQLSKYGYKLDLQVSPTQIYRDGHKDESTQNMFKKFDTQLFKEKSVLMKTAVNKPEIPWIFYLYQQSTGKEIYLVFYDTAGEKFTENLNNNVKYLRESSGVIVVIDTLSIEGVRNLLRANGLDELAGKPSNSFEEIQNALVQFRTTISESILNKPFAFAFSKFDAVLDHTDDIDFNADEFKVGDKKIDSSYIKTGKVDIAKINDISRTIEDALQEDWDAGRFVQFAKDWSAAKKGKRHDSSDPGNNYKFFGISAFGCMPGQSDTLTGVEPYRVMDPLIWILHKLGQFDIPIK